MKHYQNLFMLLIFLLMLVMEVSVAAGLTPEEKQLAAYVDQHEKAARALLRKTVNLNSGTMNFSGVKAVGDILAQEYKSLGFDVEWVDGTAFNRAGHLFASYGNKGPKLLLIGHLDTVFAKDSPFQEYVEIEGNRAKGPGVSDMKGGNVVMLLALKALKSIGLLERMSIRVVLTGDEEKRGQPLAVATKVLVDAGKWADVAIGFEDGDGNPKTAVISRRGASGWELVVKGKAAHSSQVFQPDIGYGAIYEAARILNQFRLQLISEKNLTFNPGVIVGGTTAQLDTALAKGGAFGKSNVVAKKALVNGDIRALTPEQLLRAQSKMKAIVSKNLNKTSATLVFKEGYPPMAPSEGNKKLLSMYSKLSQDLGFGVVEAVNPRNAGAADISFVASDVDMAIDGIGLMGWGGHTVEETADMNTLNSQSKRAALLMSRLLNQY